MPAGMLGIEELSREEIESILTRAKDYQPLRDQTFRRLDILKGKMIVNLFYEAAFQEAIADGEVMMAVDVGGLHCVEIDTAEDLQSARALSALLRDASRP